MNKKTPMKHTRVHENMHHLERQDSLMSQICRMHIKALTIGRLPNKFFNAYEKSEQGLELSQDEQQLSELLAAYANEVGAPTVFEKHTQAPIKWLSPYQRNILLAFSEFIDNPKRCHKGALSKLHFCKSRIKPLQFKQRVTLVKLVTTLFTFMNIETGNVGFYPSDSEEQVFDSQGRHQLKGIPHYEIRSRYHQLWGETISKTKYSDCINMLKLAEFFEVEAVYITNEEADAVKHEMRLKGASTEEIEAVPSIYSEAAYKRFTQAFFDVFKRLVASDSMNKLYMHSYANNVVKKISGAFYRYMPTSGSFFTKVRKEYLSRFGNAKRYSQGAQQQNKETETLVYSYH